MATVGEVANVTINLFVDDCLNEARENWCEGQVKMLERLFECCKKGCPYKCVDCMYLGRAGDAPETVEEGCMWEPSEEDGWNKPCEEGE